MSDTADTTDTADTIGTADAAGTAAAADAAGTAAAAPPVIRHGADAIADALGRPRPTAQQRAVIESPLVPALVVAGAGSGKTETMASRVVWLLANGLVRPDEVLGLTFTRKAAGELSVRINDRIRALEDVGLIAPGDAFEAPTVSTYNAFANAVFRENALLVGRDGESQVLTEPSAWQLARRVVVAARDDRLAGLDRDVDTLTAAVVALAGATSEHLVEPEDLRRFAIEFSELLELPGNRGKPYKAITDAVAAIGALEPLADLVAEFRRQKVDRGFVEFSDQIALALAAAESAPRVVADLRSRYGVVLLDEYQDTSVVQTRFLARLFRGHSVMAVGDPHQSIYGFRGASAANLARFPHDFGGDEPGVAEPVTFALSTSWRNPVDVLAGANAIVSPLSAASEVDVERLSPRPGADAGTVRVVFPETLPEEADEVAAWFQDHRRQDPTRSMALLLRARKDLAAFTAALGARGVPYHVLGTGGLLQRPEIVDLVACLRVLHDPAAGNDLIRLLAGARWRVGAADIVALHQLARWLFQRDHTQQRLDDDLTAAFRASVAAGEHGSIVDALDFVATAPDEHGALEGITAAGRSRMRALGGQLAMLRSRAGSDLVDFVTLVVQEMRLDIEVAAHEQGSGAYLDAFIDELAGFVSTDDRADLGSFLGWIDAAARRDDMGPRSEEPRGRHRADPDDPRVQGAGVGRRRGAPDGRGRPAGTPAGGLVRLARVRPAAVRVPRGRRRAATTRMARAGDPEGRHHGDRRLQGTGEGPQRGRGTPAHLRRPDPCQARPAGVRLVLGRRGPTHGAEPLPARPGGRRRHRRCGDPGDDGARREPDGGERRDPDLAARAVRAACAARPGRRGAGAERESRSGGALRRRHRPAARRTARHPEREARGRRPAPGAGLGFQGLPDRTRLRRRAAPPADAGATVPRHPARHALPPVGGTACAERWRARDARRVGRGASTSMPTTSPTRRRTPWSPTTTPVDWRTSKRRSPAPGGPG